MIEIWKDIKDFEGLYMVSTWGRVKSLNYLHTGREGILRPGKRGNGYLYVNLWKNGKHKSINIHQLVAQAFIPNPEKLPQINHKDENKMNNCVENLEWCTAIYNINYGTGIQRRSQQLKGIPLSEETKKKLSDANKGKHHSEETKQKISDTQKGKILSEETKKKMSDSRPNKKQVICLKNNQIIKIYPSICSTVSDGFLREGVRDVCKGLHKSHHGYIWMYLSDYEKMFGQLN